MMTILPKGMRWYPPHLHWRFVKFGLVGFLGTLLNLAVLVIGQEYLFIHITNTAVRLGASQTLAMSLATLHNFIWHRYWTWADRHFLDVPSGNDGDIPHISNGVGGGIPHISNFTQQFVRYLLASALALALQFVLTQVLSNSLHYALANIAAIPITAVINYLLNDLWTFGESVDTPHR